MNEFLLYTCCHSLNRSGFCSFPFAKTCLFSCRAKRVFPSGEALTFLVSRDSRYNTLHFASKVVCQRDTLWKPYFVRVCSHTSSKMQNKRPFPVLIYAAYLPAWASYTIAHINRSILSLLYVPPMAACPEVSKGF